jgi:DNA replication ATP-dependent helicase Dna2
VVGEHEDTLVERSIFGHLAEHAAAGTGGAPPSFLSRTYRMNAAIAEFPSRHFYDSRLAPSEQSAARRFPAAAGGPFDALWDPARPAVLALIGHAGHRTRCRPEARLAADLIEDYLGRLRLPPEELAVVTPYRAQIREIRNLLKGKGTPAAGAADAGLPLIDSVERMQGQEREAMIVSLVCSEPEYAARGAAFFFSPNRLNVALTRARTKLIVLASPLLFEALPADLAGLRGASLFARLFRELPKVDLSERYLGSTVL